MEHSREILKQKYKAGEITIKEFKNGLKELEAKERENRESQLKLLGDPKTGE